MLALRENGGGGVWTAARLAHTIRRGVFRVKAKQAEGARQCY